MLKHKRFTAGALAFIMAVGITAGCAGTEEKVYGINADETVSTEEALTTEEAATTEVTSTTQETLTTEETADYLVKAADDYNREVDKRVILKGLEDKKSQMATRLEALVMVSRAFGELKEPQGNLKKMAPPEADLSSIPDWAREDLENLKKGGVLDNSDLGIFTEWKETGKEAVMLEDTAFAVSVQMDEAVRTDEAVQMVEAAQMDGYGIAMPDGAEAGTEFLDETVPLKEIKKYCKRIYALYGGNLKDDFYASVNRDELENMDIPDRDTQAGGSSTVEAETNKKVHALIKEIVERKEKYKKGSKEQKIRDFYQSVIAPRTDGITPLEPWFQKISSADNLEELRKIQTEIIKQLGLANNGLLPVSLTGDLEDAQKKVLNLSSGFMAMMPEDYENPEGSAYKEYHASLVQTLMECQETKESAEQLADDIMLVEKEQLMAGMTEKEAADLDNYNNTFSMDELNDMMPELGAKEFLTGIGFDQSLRVQIYDVNAFKVLASHTNNKELSRIKAQIKLALLENNRMLLTGTSTEEEAREEVADYLSVELGQIYVEKYFPEEAKKGIEDMTAQMIKVFKKRIWNLDWMEEDTKKEALCKLDALTILIGYPDEWPDSKVAISSPEEGGSYYSNMAAIERDRLRKDIEKQFGAGEEFDLPAYLVNAAANRQTNILIFPAGILQAPFYDQSASFEENLGGIGVIIAHEITHIFDDQGAQYDADGNVKKWWSDTDYQHFQKLCKKAETAYEGEEAAPGITASGKDTLSENIADIGGAACALDILAEKKDADYDAFFRNYAKSWLLVTDWNTTKEQAAIDDHAPKKLRVNKVLSNFQKFFDTYDIGEGDGMYEAPEDRIVIW